MDGVVTAEAEQRESIAAGSSPSSSSSFVPRPMEGLHEMAAPPFLTKTYEIVEDPSTDSMVSWSKGRNSFIVWDSHKFSSTLLPKYFKHSNFCSFIRQLNTYGFRKVDPDRWEFANEAFLCGQKHLLKNIKRRRHAPQAFQQQSSRDCADLGQCGLESELERLKRDRKLLRSEIVKLQEQQLNSRDQIIAMEGRLRSTERKQQQMMAFLAKALSNRSFVRQLLAANPPTRGARGIEVGRKRSLPSSRSVESLREVELVAVSEGEVEEGAESQGGAGEIETELKTLLSDALVDVPNAEATPETSGGGLGCFRDLIWEELWSEDVGGRQQELGNLSDIDVEVEDLAGMASPTEPGEGFLNLFDQMGYPRSSP